MEAGAERQIHGNALTHVGGAAAERADDATYSLNNLLRVQMI
jgi:hypothetical protein